MAGTPKRERVGAASNVTYASPSGNAVVTGLTEHPRSRGRCVVELDGSRVGAISLKQLAELRVAVGSLVDPALLRKLLAAVRATSCYDKALGALARRARSSADLARWLREREFTSEEITPAVDRLVALGLLDDLSFARGFARSRLGAARGFGPRRVAAELGRRGVDRSVVDQVLAELRAVGEEGEEGEAGVLDAVVARRALGMRGLAPAVVRRRMFGYLSRRGFDSAAIWAALRRIGERADDL